MRYLLIKKFLTMMYLAKIRNAAHCQTKSGVCRVNGSSYSGAEHISKRVRFKAFVYSVEDEDLLLDGEVDKLYIIFNHFYNRATDLDDIEVGKFCCSGLHVTSNNCDSLLYLVDRKWSRGRTNPSQELTSFIFQSGRV
jgi:hypothetical protein